MASMPTTTTKSGHPAAAPGKRDGNPTTVVNLFGNRQPRVAENAAAALETMPHLVERICLLWGKAECESYLNGLLLDSRDGARRGLPWDAAQDLMFLAELSMAKRALHASEITGVPFAQMYARCQETAERGGQAAKPGLSLAPKDDPWGDPRANANSKQVEKQVPATTASSGHRTTEKNRADQKTGWLGKLLG